MAGTLGSTLTATRWVVPVPDVDAEMTVTVFNPGPDPVTAELLAADLVDRRVGATSEPELAIPPGEAKTRAPRRRSAARPMPTVVTANHPVVVGLHGPGRRRRRARAPRIPDSSPDARRRLTTWSSAW